MPGYNDVDEGSGDSGVIAAGGPSRHAVKKLDQIIQVKMSTVSLLGVDANVSSLALPYQSCYRHFTV